MTENRINPRQPKRSINKTEKTFDKELQKLVIDKETKVFYNTEELACKNSNRLCHKDKIKTYYRENKLYKLKITKLFGFKKICLEKFFNSLITILGGFWKGEVFQIKIGFGWFISDENKQTEYVSFNKSRFMDDYTFKICGNKFQLLNKILDLNFHNFNEIIKKASDSHVATTHCIHSLNENIPTEDIPEIRRVIIRDPEKYLRCSGICYFKQLKRACSMFVQIEKL